MKKTYLIVALALLLVFALAGTALAASPANDGIGQAFGAHHADMAEQGTLDGSMNPGMHQGIVGWHMGLGI